MGDRVALISGTPDGTAQALKDRGFDVHEAADLPALQGQVAALPPGGVSLYVQLPTQITARGANAVEVIRNFLLDGLLARFDAASAVLPALAEPATVVLVSGNHPGAGAGASAPDNPVARLALMKVLGHSLLLERGDGLAVKVVDHQRSPERVAAVAVEPETKPLQVVTDLAAATPELDYAAWRDAMMNLTSTRA